MGKSEKITNIKVTCDAKKHIQSDAIAGSVIFIDRKAREIMYLVASIHPSVRLPFNNLTAEKSSKSHYQSEVFVCVSVISRHMRIIALMRSIGF